MSAVDLVVTKPGGLSVSECLAKAKPMLLVSPIPGQEERNADYLLEAGAAIKAASCSSAALPPRPRFPARLDEIRGTALRTVHVPVHAWHLETEDIVQVMRTLRQTENGPFLIHCQHGADRTGLMSAMYRMLEEKWPADDALAELVDGGYGYHSMWHHIKRYLRSVDVTSLRAAVDSSTGSTETVTDN